ncbi:unnamed protein product [Trichogramma brassicae]|uniref:Uncharacterized protein n=1 Tax=Trichogramma brassicae TaxID=86971 RepID=A0A6H5ITW8_9HYME|nr:unnamed protein product [Trichogramma brassicae]
MDFMHSRVREGVKKNEGNSPSEELCSLMKPPLAAAVHLNRDIYNIHIAAAARRNKLVLVIALLHVSTERSLLVAWNHKHSIFFFHFILFRVIFKKQKTTRECYCMHIRSVKSLRPSCTVFMCKRKLLLFPNLFAHCSHNSMLYRQLHHAFKSRSINGTIKFSKRSCKIVERRFDFIMLSLEKLRSQVQLVKRIAANADTNFFEIIF